MFDKYYANNPEDFRTNAVLVSSKNRMVHFFNDIYKNRQDAAWIMFSQGRYILNGGEEIYVSGNSAELILDACVTVMNEMLDADVRYSLGEEEEGDDPLPWSRIDIESFHGYGACCATYVSRVLYISGVLSAEQINAGSFNSSGWTCGHGVEEILIKAGWTKVEVEDVLPGDVCSWHNGGNSGQGHVWIYAGKGESWEVGSAVRSRDGTGKPTCKPNKNWDTYIMNHDVCVYRAP